MALLSPFAYSISTIADSYLTNKGFRSTAAIVFYSVPVNLLLLPLMFFFAPVGMPPAGAWPSLLLIGFVGAAYFFPYFAALRKLDISIINSLFAVGKIIVPLFAYFYIGERLSPVQYVGFLLIISASVALCFDRKKLTINPALWLMFLCSASFAFVDVLQKDVVENTNWATLAFWVVALENAWAMLLLLHGRSRRRIVASAPRFLKNLPVIALTCVLTFAGVVMQDFSISVFPVTVDEAMHSTQPFWTLLFGVILFRVFKKKFKEKTDVGSVVKKAVCFAVMLIGIIMTTV